MKTIDIPMIVWLGGVQQGCAQGGGRRLLRFESPWWRPKESQVQAQFRVQEQHTLKLMPRSHTDSVLDVLYMDGDEK